MNVGVRDERGALMCVDVERWFGDAESADLDVLDQVRPAVLDIGCGPGRHVIELASRGIPVLGIDITRGALEIARRRGAPVLRRSVFDQVPGTGRWGTALLLDGNVGLGGDPAVLLTRVRSLLAPDGIALVEVRSPGTATRVRRVRFEIDGRPGPEFRWSFLPLEQLASAAEAAGFVIGSRWHRDSRWFARLDPAGPR